MTLIKQINTDKKISDHQPYHFYQCSIYLAALNKYKYLPLQLPSALLASLQKIKGFDENAFVQVHESGRQITSVRFNPAKIFESSEIHPFGGVAIPWSFCGYYLSQRPSFTLDPFFHAGAYYVQEASSMFLEQAIRQSCNTNEPLQVLDLCAAPGGKSTLIQSVISPQSLLVSNEVIKARVNILAENITKWGAANVVVTNNDAKDFQRLPCFFDLIVVDAPCSGSGLFRKDPEAIREWSLNNVTLCSQRQQRILADVLPSLKPGGILIYATCSYSESEDEAIADWLISDCHLTSINLQVKAEWNIVETQSAAHNAYGYRFYPDKVKGEGFFIAAFKNNSIGVTSKEIKLKNKPQLLSKTELEIVKPFIKNATDFSFLKWQNEVLVFPSAIYEQVLLLQSVLYLKKAGVKMGAIIRNELIPDHELAVSTILSEKINAVTVDLPTALQYLRRQDINIDTYLKGWALIKYNDLSLGLIKILPNRVNNYYPRDWRILNK